MTDQRKALIAVIVLVLINIALTGCAAQDGAERAPTRDACDGNPTRMEETVITTKRIVADGQSQVVVMTQSTIGCSFGMAQ